MGILVPLLNAVDYVSKYSNLCVTFAIIPISALVIFEVMARYVFNSPTNWSPVLTQFIFASYFVIGGAYCLLMDGHVKVDVVYSRLSPKKRAIMDIVSSTFFLAFVLTVLYFSIEETWISIVNKENTGMAWSVRIWPFKLSLPVAAFLLLLQGMAKLVRDFYFCIRGDKL